MNHLNGRTELLQTPTLAALTTIERPGTAEHVADLIRTASHEDRVVIPVGGGGALALGNPTDASAIGISTRALDRILDYQPTDMTLSVSAGATLAEVQAEIGTHGQALPIEAVDPGVATIGGLLATGLTGPRRYGGGTLRDVLIGIAVAYPDGTIGKAGGLVVKNVSGFDMMRLHYGALGTLGVIVSANFKVLPTIRDEFTALWHVETQAEAETLCTTLRLPETRPTALVAGRASDRWEVRARFEGRPGGLRAVANRLAGRLAGARYLHDKDSSAQWANVMAARSLDDAAAIRIRIGAMPTTVFDSLAVVDDLAAMNGVALETVEMEPGVGLAYVTWQAGEASADAQMLNAILTDARLPSRTILAAPDRLKADIDVWGPEPETIALMRRLKNEFDPAGVLNRGRFAGKI